MPGMELADVRRCVREKSAYCHHEDVLLHASPAILGNNLELGQRATLDDLLSVTVRELDSRANNDAEISGRGLVAELERIDSLDDGFSKPGFDNLAVCSHLEDDRKRELVQPSSERTELFGKELR